MTSTTKTAMTELARLGQESDGGSEREAIVAWLRSEAGQCDCFARELNDCACGAWGDDKLMSCADMADAIERGDHLTTPPTTLPETGHG